MTPPRPIACRRHPDAMRDYADSLDAAALSFRNLSIATAAYAGRLADAMLASLPPDDPERASWECTRDYARRRLNELDPPR